jgi:dTDP-4-dehydrorhamnose reductase
MKVVILGATGMLGHTLFTRFSARGGMKVFATARDTDGLSRWFAPGLVPKIIDGVDVGNFDSVLRAVNTIEPDVVINCIGIIKQLPVAKDPVVSITINSLFPHRLAQICASVGARMIHISTDCVFSGDKGSYTERDRPDADDLYGRTKLLGEVDYPHCVTLRTSIIGHELKGAYGLIGWFLSQEGRVKGFTKAIYSGFPTVELARIIADYVIPQTELHGLYQVSSEPISKYDLLCLVANRYGKKIEVEPYAGFVSDRSLNSDRFRQATGYNPPSWPELVDNMYRDYLENRQWYGEKEHS